MIEDASGGADGEVGAALEGAVEGREQLGAVHPAVRRRRARVGATALHARLHSRREELVNECRALASQLGGEALWLEKVQLGTVALQRPVQQRAQR